MPEACRASRRAGRWLACAALVGGAALPAQLSLRQQDGPTLNSYVLAAPGAWAMHSAFDSTRGRLVVADYGEGLFEHDGGQWLCRGPAGSTAFLRHDPVAGRILRGTADVSGLRLTGFDGIAWTPLPGFLAGVTSFGMPVFDAGRNRLVLPGASGGAWWIQEWDGAVWQQRVALPANAYANGFCYDPAQARTLLRIPGSGIDQLWSWDGTSLAPIGTLPQSQVFGSFWNPATNRPEFVGSLTTSTAFLTGLFAWNGTSMVQIAALPAPFSQQSTACCDDTGRVHFVQAATTNGLGGTWVWTNGAWHAVSNGNGALRVHGAMAFAPTQGKLVFTGGLARGTERFLGTTLWNGHVWTWSAGAPSPLRGHTAAAADPLGRGVVLFGGEASTGNPFGYGVLGDTWLWNGSSWQALSGGPPARSYCAMALDSVRQRVVMCGGFASPTGTPVALADTWEWDGATWAAAANMPLARARHALAYDAARGRTVLFGGTAAGGLRDDTLLWDGSAWVPTSPQQRPPAGWPGMAFDPDLGVVALAVHGAASSGLWHWNGVDWSAVPIVLPALPGLAEHEPNVAFDAVRRRLLYHNGVHLHALSPSPSAVNAYGSGCGRALPFTSAHPPRPGGVIACDLAGTAPGALVAVGLGIGAGATGLANGCTLLLQGDLGGQITTANASGFAAVAFPLPDALALRGVTVRAQGAALDAASPGGFALTAGLAVAIGD